MNNQKYVQEQIEKAKLLIGPINNQHLNSAISIITELNEKHSFKKVKEGALAGTLLLDLKEESHNHIINFFTANNVFEFASVDYKNCDENENNNSGIYTTFYVDKTHKELHYINEKQPFYVDEENFIYDIDNVLLEKSKSHKYYRGNTKIALLENITYDKKNPNISITYLGTYTTIATEGTTANEKIWLYDSNDNSYEEIDSDLYFLYKIGEISGDELKSLVTYNKKSLILKGDKINNE